ncbi:hypothetical protein [Thermomonospora umbrina]|uniref:hypothetical protein n=1 Tax=Thermomonospora umbrina TaxID=111806 RepID=UPI0011C1CA1D|nr:hypothetical protein [Thermomonospora umbrina]
MEEVDRLARTAVARARRDGWAGSDDYDGQFAVAWDAVASAVYTAEEPPSGGRLVYLAQEAVGRDHDQYRRHHGARDNARAFGAYWLGSAGPTPSPERSVVERAALAQIWPRLAPYQQRALTALATFGDYQRAADALGLAPKTFTTAISQARREFLRLWHEGETPSRPWGTDRRQGSGRDPVTRRVKNRKGLRRTEPVHGKPSTYRNHRCRCDPCREAARVEQREYKARKKAAA